MVKVMKEIFKYIGLLFLSMLIILVGLLIFIFILLIVLFYIGSVFLFMVFVLIFLKRNKVNILEFCSFYRIIIKDIIFLVLLVIFFLFVYGGICGFMGIENLIFDRNEYYNRY